MFADDLVLIAEDQCRLQEMFSNLDQQYCTLQYHEKMCHVISHCARNCKNIVMFGDFNLPLIQWSNFTFPNTMPYNTFAECINENSLIQHVNFPTRGSNILDLVFTADPLLVSQVTSQDHFSFLDSVSDHTALVLCLNVRYEPATETPIEKHFDFRRANMFLLKSLIVAVNWEMLLANTTIDTNIDTMIDTFYDTFWSICEKCVPIVISSRRINKSNYPQHIVKLGSKCKRLSKCKHIKPRGILQWRTAQREYMLAIQHFVNNRECTVLQSGDSSAFYRYINQRRACKHGIAPLLDANSELAVTDHDKADILNAQFTSIFTVDDGILPQVETRTQSQLSDINLSPEVIRKFMCTLPNKFSRSPDGIPSAVLRSLSFELCTPLYYLFRQSLDTGTCPSLWKSADITPVYKKGDASLASNYRPISITPAICRLFERILADSINYHMHAHNLITDSQYGFVKGRSTELQLLNCTNIWIKSMDQKLFTDTVYIDLAKAFDTVSHTKLLHKLPCYGISGNILNWVSSFLNNRKQRVKIGNYFSVYKNVTSGVPQGSCIGPLLFILYVNDLTDYNFDRNTLVSLYADDTKISTIFSDVSERHNMQEHLNEFMRWAAKWQLQIAEHKCCVLSHGNVTQPIYYMHTVQLPNVNECLDLGVFVDSHCSFKHHISHICCKAYTSINIIFRCFDTAHVPALIIAYKSFVRPILEYCSTVWNPYIPNRHYLGLTDQIERVQRYFTRRVYYRCKLDCSHDYLQRLKFLNLESLELRRIYNDLIMVYKIVHGLININANELIHIKTSTSTISTRGHRFKLQTSQFKLDVAKNQLCNRVVCNWNTLPDSIVATDTIAHFKKALRTVHFEAALTFNRHC